MGGDWSTQFLTEFLAAVSSCPDPESARRTAVERAADAAFSPEDINLLRGMARVLTLALRMMHVLDRERALREESQARADENANLLASLEERRRLLEQLSRIQE